MNVFSYIYKIYSSYLDTANPNHMLMMERNRYHYMHKNKITIIATNHRPIRYIIKSKTVRVLLVYLLLLNIFVFGFGFASTSTKSFNLKIMVNES